MSNIITPATNYQTTIDTRHANVAGMALKKKTSSGTNLFSVFSCIGSFWNHMDSVCSNSAKSVNAGCWPSEPLDSLIGCVLTV